jgi:glycosyltransferase involved in cell wall biosynthesis
MSAPAIHVVLSAPEMFGFMKGQPQRLRSLGFEPVIISSASTVLDQQARAEGLKRITIPICRPIALSQDAKTFYRLCQIFRKDAPQAVLLSGPKAIFLGSMAAWVCAVPQRIVIYHGMRQENMRGLLRVILDLCDKVSFACATKALAVSPSLRALVIDRRLTSASTIQAIKPGTPNGIDISKYHRTPQVVAESVTMQQTLGILPDVPVIGFLGRITEDKGVADLYKIFLVLQEKFPDLRLLCVGPAEMLSTEGRQLLVAMKANRAVIFTGSVSNVLPYLCLMKVHVFPSHREGFGLSVAEAGALGVPTVAYDVTGVKDAIVANVTGKLVQRGDVAAMVQAASDYLCNDSIRLQHGNNAAHRIREDFAPDRIWNSYLEALG